MAAINSTRTRGIQIEDYSWGRIVEGTREMLIQHGYTLDVMFPGDPGARKTVEHRTDAAGRAIKIKRKSKYKFAIWRYWNEEEEAWYYKRDAQKKEVERAARMREEEIRRAKELVNSWPKTEDAFRKASLEYADFWLGILETKLIDGESGGWRYDDATTHKIERLTDQMIELIKTGGVVEDMALKEQNIPACIADEVFASEAKLAEIPRYKVEGNVIRLGR